MRSEQGNVRHSNFKSKRPDRSNQSGFKTRTERAASVKIVFDSEEEPMSLGQGDVEYTASPYNGVYHVFVGDDHYGFSQDAVMYIRAEASSFKPHSDKENIDRNNTNAKYR